METVQPLSETAFGGFFTSVERNGHKRGRAVQNHERGQNANPMGF